MVIARRLEEWDLIEEVGRVNESGGIPERVFGLTDAGREFVEEYLTEERERPDSYEMRIERLEDEVDDLQTTNERLEVKVDQQNDISKISKIGLTRFSIGLKSSCSDQTYWLTGPR